MAETRVLSERYAQIGLNVVNVCKVDSTPDVDIDDILWEIKSPESANKTTDLLANAAKKFEPYPGRRPRAIVSTARLTTGTLDDVMGVAQRFVDDSTFEEILVVTEREIIPIKR